jgi:acyl-CoA synthetase (NDP forming)
LATCYSDLANAALCRRAHEAGIPVIDGAHETLLAFRHLFNYRKFKQQRQGDAVPRELDDNRVRTWKQKLADHATDSLGEAEALALLADFGIPVVNHATVSSEAELLTAAAKIAYPLVLKTAQPGINHKSDSNGVLVNIQSEPELLAGYHDLRARLGPVALVSQMVQQGIEIALGTINDAQFGPIVMVAAGGILVELLSDKAVAMCPASAMQAGEMIDSLQANRLLLGVRGKPAANRRALIDSIVGLSAIAYEFRESIAEIDLNPVLVNQQDALAVDALILRKNNDSPC